MTAADFRRLHSDCRVAKFGSLVVEPENPEPDSIATTKPVWALESPGHPSTATLILEQIPKRQPKEMLVLPSSELATSIPATTAFVGVPGTVKKHLYRRRQLYVFGIELTAQVQADLQVLGRIRSYGVGFVHKGLKELIVDEIYRHYTQRLGVTPTSNMAARLER